MSEIAVIIPLFNGSRWIQRTLQSVLSQTRPAREVVVVDDGSTDDSREVVSSFPAVRLISNNDKGGGAARNLGLRVSNSPLLAFLDQDDVWHPRHLELLAGALDREPSAVAACSLGTSIGDDDEPWFDRDLDARAEAIDLWSVFPFGLVRCPGLVLCRRQSLESIGGWNTESKYVADIELWMCVNRLGSFLQFDAVTMGVRVHHDSYSGVLRIQRIDRYIEALQCFAERLAKNVNPSIMPADRLARRLNLVRAMVLLARAFVANNRSQFREAIRTIETVIDPESASFRSQTLHTLLWFFAPNNLPDEKRRLLVDFYGIWPDRKNEREILRQAFLAWPTSFWVKEYRDHPSDPARWKLLAQSTMRRLLRPGGPLDLAGVDADGWARNVWFVRGDTRRSTTRMRLRLHLPTWSGLNEQQITIHSPCSPPKIARLTPGDHTIVIDASEATIEARSLFRLPSEHRERSLRVLSATGQIDLHQQAG